LKNFVKRLFHYYQTASRNNKWDIFRIHVF
jgi:hypothetical protein